MASFDLVLPLILKFEGGYVDNPRDPGGETNRGITMAVFQRYAHNLLGVEPSSLHLRELTEAQAAVLYRELYWKPIQGDAYESQELANIVCDFYVNAGTHATVLLQRVLQSMGGHVACDGCLGAQTLAVLHMLPQAEVYRRYKAGRVAFYQKLGQRYPEFLAGWLARTNAFADLPRGAEDPGVAA